MDTKRTIVLQALAVAVLVVTSFAASAEHERRERHEDYRDFGERHDIFRDHRDIRYFDRHDYDVWRTGGWRHGRHDGRLGWWWVVAGVWYFYPEPIYPYPDPYTPPVIVTQPAPQPVAPPPAQFWYFCTSANGYYPYVPSCPEGWKSVPATPPAAAPAAR